MKMMKRMMLGAAVAALGLTASAVTGTKVTNLTTLKNMASTGGECYISAVGGRWLTETITIPAGKTLTIDFYGYELPANHAGYAFDVSGTLVIKNTDGSYSSSLYRSSDFQGDASLKSLFRVNNGGVLTINPGTGKVTIKDNVGCTEDGGAVQINGGTFNMYAKTTIQNCSTKRYGGAVYVNGTFNMHDGTIGSCSATSSGGAVYVDTSKTFNLYGGTIQNCTADTGYGGGVESYGTVNMSGGTIQNCRANNHAGGGIDVENKGTLNMSGGKITGCYAAFGGGVGVYGAVAMSGGEISGNSAANYNNSSVGSSFYVNRDSVKLDITGGTVIGRLKIAKGAATALGYCTVNYFDGSYSNNGTKSKITFDFQSGSGGTASVDPATYGQAMPAATMPTRTGYTFLGYYDATSGGTQYYKADGTSARNWDKVVAATTLYARWSENTATLSYNANGHGTAPTAVTMKYTAACNAAAAITGVTGYTFSKWNTKADGTGTSYNANAQVKAANVDPTATTLYAIWTANAYTVAFDGNGAMGGATASLSCTYDVAFTMQGCGFTKDGGYAFTGWNTAADGSGTAYAAGANCLNLSATQGATVTLYAQWAAEGADGNPWSVGGNVVAYTNGTGGLVVSGTGAAGDFSKDNLAPWAAFADQIKSVTIADGVTGIGSRFFKGCTRLGTVTGGKNLVSVGENAFYQCMSLETIQLDNADVLETLKNAIVYQTAIKKDGSLYTIPSITLPGCKSVLYGTNDLGDPDSWQPVDSDKTMEASGYHFFKFVLKKIEE